MQGHGNCIAMWKIRKLWTMVYNVHDFFRSLNSLAWLKQVKNKLVSDETTIPQALKYSQAWFTRIRKLHNVFVIHNTWFVGNTIFVEANITF